VTAGASARETVGDRGCNGRLARGADRTARSALTLLLLAVLALIGVAGLTALGVWQLERRVWKLDLIDRIERKIHAAPVSIPPPDAWHRINTADNEYVRVSVTGRFLHDRETLVQAVTERGPGFWVLTPMRIDTGSTVLINRGFVPQDRRDPATRWNGNPAGEVRVTGLLRMTEPDGAFLRTNDPAAGRWYSRDVPAIAAARGLSQPAPFFIDADATPNPGGWPAGGLTVVTFRNHHLVYALTWFALALLLGGAAVRVAREEWRLHQGSLDSGSSFVSKHVSRKRHSFAAPDHRC
jgi:surfeit locus 1 family protein